ncbi:hypothetical protein [Streptomyces albireticuli]|uniref:Muconolactone isomerase domain-containing protein n=1 Tax=Streptomyces albireticuli TaxID=1940 RepID=A0A2A2CYM9_9ACTN|nr:hypothetical protein [Streptomyces albireticuli]MCD9140633.1 hypothetical protein [Streptomyces albireticuli]MCD9161405.1 hypothetical protein [Streptomyces albireticuli]MCD9193025.1 hypothetical protein [Streptomyces albireticuli]PAU44210.1 hypothetical protein CK936_36145 [Streptomyces albireticuli]
MRTLLRARMDTRAGNEAIRNGSMPEAIQALMDQLKPEAAYFTAMDGGRTCILVFDMEDSSQMPVVAEKLFLDMEAEVEMHPVMNYDDLKKGLSSLSRG